VRNKYGAKRQSYGGNHYHSKLEATVAARLDTLRSARVKAERVTEVRRQVAVPLMVNGKTVATWKVDFLVTYGDGREEYVEAKGFETADYRIKRNLFEALFPDRTLRIVRA
jgi:hypothetical protein